MPQRAERHGARAERHHARRRGTPSGGRRTGKWLANWAWIAAVKRGAGVPVFGARYNHSFEDCDGVSIACRDVIVFSETSQSPPTATVGYVGPRPWRKAA